MRAVLARVARWWLSRRLRSASRVHPPPRVLFPGRDPLLLVAVGDHGVAVGVTRAGGPRWTPRLPRGVGTTVLARCRRPRAVRPADLGLPYVVAGAPPQQRYYGPLDDVSEVLDVDVAVASAGGGDGA